MEEAMAYDAMDHAEVNRLFVDDLIEAGFAGGDVLDVGTGTARIPVELGKREWGSLRVMAIDLSIAMLDVARIHVEIASLREVIELDHVDAKALPYGDGTFDATISNSIVHHLVDPQRTLAAILRVTKEGGVVFVRDLLRPKDVKTLNRLVEQYVAPNDEKGRAMFRDSLHAALTLEEVRAYVEEIGEDPAFVSATSDRHWTWTRRVG